MTAVDRPDNGQDEGRGELDCCGGSYDAGGEAHYTDCRSLAYVAGAGEQRQEVAEGLVADVLAEHQFTGVGDDGWTRCLCGWSAGTEGDDDDGSHARHLAAVLFAPEVRDHLADELLALLGGPQPDGEAVEAAQLATCSDRHTDGDLTVYCEQIPGHVGPHVNHRIYW